MQSLSRLKHPRNELQLPAAARRKGLIMGNNNKSCSMVTGQFQHQLKYAIRSRTVQIARWLIGQHTSGLRHQGSRQRNALPFTARQFSRSMMQPILQTHLGQHLRRFQRTALGRHAPDPQRHRDVVLRTELRQQMVELVDKTKMNIAQTTLLGRTLMGQVLPLQHHGAMSGSIQTSQQVKQRAFARS